MFGEQVTKLLSVSYLLPLSGAAYSRVRTLPSSQQNPGTIDDSKAIFTLASETGDGHGQLSLTSWYYEHVGPLIRY